MNSTTVLLLFQIILIVSLLFFSYLTLLFFMSWLLRNNWYYILLMLNNSGGRSRLKYLFLMYWRYWGDFLLNNLCLLKSLISRKFLNFSCLNRILLVYGQHIRILNSRIWLLGWNLSWKSLKLLLLPRLFRFFKWLRMINSIISRYNLITSHNI